MFGGCAPSLGSAIVHQLKRSGSVLCRLDHCGLVSLHLTLPRCLLVALCLPVRLPLVGRESSRQTQPCRRRSSSSTVRQRQTPSSCGAVITNPNPHAALVPSALLSFVSCREVTRFCDRWTGAHSALCAFVLPPSKSGRTLFVGYRIDTGKHIFPVPI